MDSKANYPALQILLLGVDIIPVLNIKLIKNLNLLGLRIDV